MPGDDWLGNVDCCPATRGHRLLADDYDLTLAITGHYVPSLLYGSSDWQVVGPHLPWYHVLWRHRCYHPATRQHVKSRPSAGRGTAGATSAVRVLIVVVDLYTDLGIGKQRDHSGSDRYWHQHPEAVWGMALSQ